MPLRFRMATSFLFLALGLAFGVSILWEQKIKPALGMFDEGSFPMAADFPDDTEDLANVTVEGPETFRVTLYFQNDQGNGWITESRNIIHTGSVTSRAKQALAELGKGPRRGGNAVLPKKARLLGLVLDHEGTAYVNFSVSMRNARGGGSGSELFSVYSIVRTLTANFPEISKVRILLDGQEVDSLGGHIFLGSGFRGQNAAPEEKEGAKNRL